MNQKIRENRAIAFGEVLMDIFPAHQTIGGAPLNVACRLQSLGVDTGMISSVGLDDPGDDIRRFIKEKDLDVSLIQMNQKYPTGLVHVQLDADKNATYDIVHPSAWDAIDLRTDDIDKVSRAELFIYGSLATRSQQSYDTLQKLLPHAHYKVFDINLRPPHHTQEIVMMLMKKADFIKCNEEELEEISAAWGQVPISLRDKLIRLVEKTNTSTICVTRGAAGAVLYTGANMYENSGYSVTVMDTVGSGDSFLAALLYQLIFRKETPQDALNFACAMGALVATHKGANAYIPPAEVRMFLQNATS